MSDVLCAKCEACMCDDCRSMVGEYVTLFENWRHRAAVLEHQAQEVQKERDDALRQAEHFKAVAVAGVGDIMRAWILSMDIERIDKAIQSQEKRAGLIADMDTAIASLNWKLAKEIREKLEW